MGDVLEAIRFGDVEIDPAILDVRVGGESQRVEPQVFDVLWYLARHRDRVVTKNELLDNIWGDRFVSESALTTRIKTARRVTGDDGRSQRVIRTSHGRGYQFIAEVDVDRTQSDDDRGSTGSSGSSGDAGGGSAATRTTTWRPSQTFDEIIGREDDLATLLDALEAHRLVSLVGPGGVGKTRLAFEAARAWEGADRTVHVVELDAIDSESQAMASICEVLGVRPQGDVDLVGLVAQELRGADPLLVLDNVEHVSGAAGQIDEIRRRAPGARLCVTSRERLRVSDELVIGLDPLDASPELGRGAPAVRLFEARARRADPSFSVDDTNATLVAEICELVDGLPLGLDLAAAQLRYMPLPYLRTHLERSATSIGNELHDRPRRQWTVDQLIGWSHDQLTPSSRDLLAELSVFRGGIPLSGIRAVGGFGSDREALEAVAVLVDKSLVTVEPTANEPRYGVLNLIRSFGAERLAASGRLDAVRRAHAAWVADIVGAIEADRWDRNVTGWLDDLGRVYPNLDAALEYLSGAGELATLGRIIADTNLWWYRVGRHAEARQWVGRALSAGDALDARSRGRLNFVAGLLRFAARDPNGSTEHLRASIEHAASVDDWRYAQLATAQLAIRAVGDPDAVPEAVSELEAVISAAQNRSEVAVEAYASNVLGVLLHRSGRGDEARALHERGTRLNRQIGDHHSEAINHANLGHIEVEAGRAVESLPPARTALRLASRSGSSVLAAWVLAEIAAAQRMLGDSHEAAVLLGAADAYTDAIGAHRGPAAHQGWHDVTTGALRADLGDDEFERLHASGAQLALRDAVERALDEVS